MHLTKSTVTSAPIISLLSTVCSFRGKHECLAAILQKLACICLKYANLNFLRESSISIRMCQRTSLDREMILELLQVSFSDEGKQC